MRTLKKRLMMAVKRSVKINKLKGLASRKGKVFLSGVLPSVGYGSAINAPHTRVAEAVAVRGCCRHEAEGQGWQLGPGLGTGS